MGSKGSKQSGGKEDAKDGGKGGAKGGSKTTRTTRVVAPGSTPYAAAPAPKKRKRSPAEVLAIVESNCAELEGFVAQAEAGNFDMVTVTNAETGSADKEPSKGGDGGAGSGDGAGAAGAGAGADASAGEADDGGGATESEASERARIRVAYLDETITQQMLKMDDIERIGDLRAHRKGLYKRLGMLGDRIEALKHAFNPPPPAADTDGAATENSEEEVEMEPAGVAAGDSEGKADTPAESGSAKDAGAAGSGDAAGDAPATGDADGAASKDASDGKTPDASKAGEEGSGEGGDAGQ